MASDKIERMGGKNCQSYNSYRGPVTIHPLNVENLRHNISKRESNHYDWRCRKGQ